MKKAIIVLNFLIIFITGCNHASQAPKATEPSQPALKQQPDFTGIYEFQINKTTVNDLQKLPYRSHEITMKSAITERIETNGPSRVTDWDLLCNDVRKFKVDDFAKGSIQYTIVTLTFYQDTLIGFGSVSSNGIVDVLMAKYPNYTEANGSRSSISWKNYPIMAGCGYSDSYSVAFFIYDIIKTTEIAKQTETAKAKYLKKANANM